MIKDLISVIIPTYFRSDYIGRAIDSILNQTYQNFEILVIDDNNPDTVERKKLENIMNKYLADKRIKYIQHEKNMNGSNARNTGIRASKGEYITFLDDDDYFLKKRFEIIIDYMKKNTFANAAYTSCIIRKNNKYVEIREAQKSGNLLYEMLCQNTVYGTGSNMFFKSESLKEINGFDGSFLRHQDVETMVRFFNNKNQIIAIPEILVVKVSDYSMNPNIEKSIYYKEFFLEKFEFIINKYNDSKNIYLKNYISLLKLASTSGKWNDLKKIKDRAYKRYKVVVPINKIIYFYIINILKFIPLKEIKHFYYDIKIKKRIKKDILQEIFTTEGKEQ